MLNYFKLLKFIYRYWNKHGKKYSELTDREKAIFYLKEETRGKITGWGGYDRLSQYMLPKDHPSPAAGFDFYFEDNFLSLCVDKRFLENDSPYVNNLKAKDYLLETINNIEKDLIDSQLWKKEGSQFILNFNENEGIVLVGANNKKVKTYSPISYSDEEILEDREQRLLAIEKKNYSKIVEENIDYLIRKTKIKNLSANDQFKNYIADKFFDTKKNVIAAHNFFNDRLNSIAKACEGIESTKELVIHYDERIGTVLKNEKGKYLLRFPEEEQLNKLRNSSSKPTKSKKNNL